MAALAGCDGSGGLPPLPLRGVDAAFEPPPLSGPYAVGWASFHWTPGARKPPVLDDPAQAPPGMRVVHFP